MGVRVRVGALAAPRVASHAAQRALTLTLTLTLTLSLIGERALLKAAILTMAILTMAVVTVAIAY